MSLTSNIFISPLYKYKAPKEWALFSSVNYLYCPLAYFNSAKYLMVRTIWEV